MHTFQYYNIIRDDTEHQHQQDIVSNRDIFWHVSFTSADKK
jgi:hypothetical protein